MHKTVQSLRNGKRSNVKNTNWGNPRERKPRKTAGIQKQASPNRIQDMEETHSVIEDTVEEISVKEYLNFKKKHSENL